MDAGHHLWLARLIGQILTLRAVSDSCTLRKLHSIEVVYAPVDVDNGGYVYRRDGQHDMEAEDAACVNAGMQVRRAGFVSSYSSTPTDHTYSNSIVLHVYRPTVRPSGQRHSFCAYIYLHMRYITYAQ